MNLPALAVGIAAVGFGGYTAWARSAKPGAFGKLEAMKQKWGEKAGSAIHLVAYTVVPIAFGIVAILCGVKGVSIS